jgi:hypothetical protein
MSLPKVLFRASGVQDFSSVGGGNKSVVAIISTVPDMNMSSNEIPFAFWFSPN